MSKELPKAYEPQKYEDAIYERWETSGFFNPDNLTGEPYSIMMPPPNVTGVLHLGHAMENSLMDTMARYQRMNGKKVLLLPGTDHAAVATQAKVEKELVKKGIEKPREFYGREKLLELIREYAENSKATILRQIKKLGTSCDWSRLAYTFDEQRNLAVKTVFKKMYDDGLIYHGHRVVNWSVKGQSTCSDDELVHVERPSKLYYFKYSKDFPITIATTRPETKLGDTAVAVNPHDKRYKKYIGKVFNIEKFAGGPNLEIKIIADEKVVTEFGTGAVGVTPAHSMVDFEMYLNQKAKNDPINLIEVIDKNGKMTDKASNLYQGLLAEKAREEVSRWLRENDLLEKEEDILQNVGTSDRFGDIVEALPMTQWFIDVNKKVSGKEKSLKELMKEAVTLGHNGISDQKVNITPERFEKIYFGWIENLRDWCISRQIWWGHRIPVWYKGEEIYCGIEEPTGEGWLQDADTLDTWFSSGTWTFSTLGWPGFARATPGKPGSGEIVAGKPEFKNDLEQFHPTSWMQMGYEIVFFWMARMILMSTYALDQIPFKDVYIHGMLRNEEGKKFSKSAGNNIDPLEVIEEYGADALRISVLLGISPGNDSKFYDEKIDSARNFVNKLWNISRFMLLNIPESKIDVKIPELETLADKWILNRLLNVTKQVTDNIEKFNFSQAGEALRDFTWSDLADWYLEVAKIEGGKSEILNYILNALLKLWHPFMPFVTEQIWSEIYGNERMLMVEKWPMIEIKTKIEIKINEEFELIKNIITGLRSLRAENKIEPVKKLNATISAGENVELLKDNVEIIKGLARLEKIEIKTKIKKPETSVGFVVSGVEVFVDLAGAVDAEAEKVRLQKEITSVEPYAIGLEKKLSNKEFVNNAPVQVVEAEKKKLVEAKEKLEKLKQQLNIFY